MINPYAAIREQLLKLPEDKQRLLARRVSGSTTDTRKRCGCLFGTLVKHVPVSAAERALNPDVDYGAEDGNATIMNRYRFEPLFTRWVDDVFGDVPEPLRLSEVRLLETINDETEVGSRVITPDNTEAGCRARFLRMIDELTRRDAEWEATHVQQ